MADQELSMITSPVNVCHIVIITLYESYRVIITIWHTFTGDVIIESS